MKINGKRSRTKFSREKITSYIIGHWRKKKIVVLRQDCIDLDYEGQIMSIFNY